MICQDIVTYNNNNEVVVPLFGCLLTRVGTTSRVLWSLVAIVTTNYFIYTPVNCTLLLYAEMDMIFISQIKS